MQLPLASIIPALIPLAAGILFLLYPEQLLAAKDRANEKKQKLLKRCGGILVIIGIGYLFLAFIKL
ncbi:DUF2065 family protein [Lacibacter luteus]|uniref:DUF2065 family protein n=1 Tax=Lacibacter luteus TaxID=2508719 RepID=A0A4Q1CPG4_9BACT|nr:DUF2065 family protein [Lacibacter luteus]RXK62611.1 DUF2065 family protein [Lacibacter luteus]